MKFVKRLLKKLKGHNPIMIKISAPKLLHAVMNLCEDDTVEVPEKMAVWDSKGQRYILDFKTWELKKG